MSELRDMQLAELDLLDFFANICEENNLTYYLIGGTLLGAIRHKGFIPWDDDIDVGMPRKDYQKFVNIMNTEKSESYVFNCGENDASSFLMHGKLKIKGTTIEQPDYSIRDNKSEIFIDIFPFDNAPDLKIKRFYLSWKISLIRKVLLLKLDYDLYSKLSGIKKILVPFLY